LAVDRLALWCLLPFENHKKALMRQRPIEVDHAKRIVVLGYYGVGNFGDELMLKNLIPYLEPNHIRIVAYNLAPLWIEHLYEKQVEIIRISREHSLRARLETNAKLAKIIRESDIVVYGGGTFLFDNVDRSYRNLFGVLRVTLLCRLFAKKLGLIAIGIGKLETGLGQQIARFVLQSADLVTTRDKDSFGEAVRIIGRQNKRIIRTTDLAFLNSASEAETNPRSVRGNMFTIAVCGMEFDHRTGVEKSEEELSGYLAPVLDQVVADGIEIWFVPMQTGAVRDDNNFHHKVRGKMKNANSTKIIDVAGGQYATICRALREAHLVIGMRLHSLAFALSVGTPVLALAVSEKVRRFVRECSLDQYMLDVKDIAGPQLFRDALTRAINDIGKDEYPDLRELASRQTSLARTNVSALEELL